jgi:hypothetical protein
MRSSRTSGWPSNGLSVVYVFSSRVRPLSHFRTNRGRDSLTFVKGMAGMSEGMPYSSVTVLRQWRFGNPERCRQRGRCSVFGVRCCPVTAGSGPCYQFMRARFAVTVSDRVWVCRFGVTV